MRFDKKLVSLVLGSTFAVGAAYAQPGADVDQSYALAEKAIAHIKAVGPEKAFRDFTSKDAKWHSGGHYVYVVKFDGTMVANGANKALVGKNVMDAKDVNGKPFVKDMTTLVKDWAVGGVEYAGANPMNGKPELKASYGMRIPNFEGVVAVSSADDARGWLAAQNR